MYQQQSCGKCKREGTEANQFGCAWSFSGMFDHNHDRPHWKLLSDVSHGNKKIEGEFA